MNDVLGTEMEGQGEALSCYVAIPASIDIHSIAGMLAARNVKLLRLDQFDRRESIANSVRRLIARADLVVAVLPWSQERENILIEIGAAIARQKPILIIGSEVAPAPSILMGLPYVRASMDDTQAIETQLDIFIDRIRRGTPKKPWRKKPGARRLPWLSTALEHLHDSSDPSRDLIGVVARLFSETEVGARTSTEFRDEYAQVDLAAWLPALDPSQANPIYVETKAGHLSENRLLAAEAHLRAYLRERNGLIGLVVYWDQEGRRFTSPVRGSPIQWSSIEDLGELVESGTLTDRLIEARNRAVHGL